MPVREPAGVVHRAPLSRTQEGSDAMSTTGWLGFAIDGTLKIAVTGSDSYPDGGVGEVVLAWLIDHQSSIASAARAGTTNNLVEQIRALRVVAAEGELSADDRQWIQDHTELNLDNHDLYVQNYVEQYTEGDLDAILKSGVVVDATDRLTSWVLDWGYLIDMDASRLEVYIGAQRAPHEKGRFAHLPPAPNGYYLPALCASWPLAELPTMTEFFDALSTCGEPD
jgi:hypothetical protein